MWRLWLSLYMLSVRLNSDLSARLCTATFVLVTYLKCTASRYAAPDLFLVAGVSWDPNRANTTQKSGTPRKIPRKQLHPYRNQHPIPNTIYTANRNRRGTPKANRVSRRPLFSSMPLVGVTETFSVPSTELLMETIRSRDTQAPLIFFCSSQFRAELCHTIFFFPQALREEVLRNFQGTVLPWLNTAVLAASPVSRGCGVRADGALPHDSSAIACHH